MIRPPGVNQGTFAAALQKFADAIGKQWVFTSDEDVDLYRDSYSVYKGEKEEYLASAALAPDTVEQVQAIVRIANQYKIPIYPFSTGRNLGYGGSAPSYSGSVVLGSIRLRRRLDGAVPSATRSITAPARRHATTSRTIAAWRSCCPMATCSAPAWAVCPTRRPGRRRPDLGENKDPVWSGHNWFSPKSWMSSHSTIIRSSASARRSRMPWTPMASSRLVATESGPSR